MVSYFLLKRPNEFVVNRDELFFALAVAAHPRRLINCDTLDQLIEHEPVQFLKAGVLLDEFGKTVNICRRVPHLFQRLPDVRNRSLQRCFLSVIIRDKHREDVIRQFALDVVLISPFQLDIQLSKVSTPI